MPLPPRKAMSWQSDASGGALVRPAGVAKRGPMTLARVGPSPFLGRVKRNALPEQSEDDVKTQLIAEILVAVFGSDETKSLPAHTKGTRAEGETWQGAKNRWFGIRGGRVVPVKNPNAEPKKPKESKPGQAPRAPAKIHRMTLDQARETMAELKSQGPTEERLEVLVASLATLTVKDLATLKKEVGAKGGKVKADLIAKIKATLGVVKQAEADGDVEDAEPSPVSQDARPTPSASPESVQAAVQQISSTGKYNASGYIPRAVVEAVTGPLSDDALKDMQVEGKVRLDLDGNGSVAGFISTATSGSIGKMPNTGTVKPPAVSAAVTALAASGKYRFGTVPIPDVLDEIKRTTPGMTDDDARATLMEMGERGELRLVAIGDTSRVDPAKLRRAIPTGSGNIGQLLYSVEIPFPNESNSSTEPKADVAKLPATVTDIHAELSRQATSQGNRLYRVGDLRKMIRERLGDVSKDDVDGVIRQLQNDGIIDLRATALKDKLTPQDWEDAIVDRDGNHAEALTHIVATPPTKSISTMPPSPFLSRVKAKAMPPSPVERPADPANEDDEKAELIAAILDAALGGEGEKSLPSYTKATPAQKHPVDVPYQTPKGAWRVVREFAGGKLRSVPAKAPGGAAKPAPKKPAENKPPAAKKPKPVKIGVDDAAAKIDDMRRNGTSEEKVTSLVGELATLTVPDLKKLATRMGVKPGKLKKDELVNKVRDIMADYAVPDDVEQIPESDAMDDGEMIVLDDPTPVPSPTDAAPPTLAPPPKAPATNPAKDFPIVNQKLMSSKDDTRLRELTKSYGWGSVERKTANYYTMEGYQGMNAFLRTGKGDARDVAAAEKMAAMIEAAPPIDPPVRVFRGMVMPQEQQAKYIEEYKAAAASGEPVELNGFPSTSIRPSVISNFDGVVQGRVVEKPLRYQIEARKGVYLEGVTDFEDENEVLLPHGNKYAVGEIREDAAGGYTISMVQLE